MHPLQKPLRRKLEDTVKEARDIAEPAARTALEQLGVGEAAPYSHLSEPERELRRKLRVHGRQLGDLRNSKAETQEIDRLVEEVAYEHWHRMLFARFLAENDLLMYPDPDDPVAVTLEECEDLAADEGAKNGWELASRFAARMLPQIFRPDSPVFQLELPPEHQQELERLVGELPVEVFTASDSLGWVYQFWQSKKKDEVNASEVKIGARELPAVTQLFTEPYMVSFLLDNTLGAWWAARRLSDSDLESARSEAELRARAALPSLPLEYLRFVRHEDSKWAPAGGTFRGWPDRLNDFKLLDPCCGSGHFLVTAFLMLVPMRMELDQLSVREAVDAVLSDNLYGLEIDRRCTEIAAFNLALAAWRFTGYQPLPQLNIACTGLSIGDNREQWMTVLDGQGAPMNLRFFFGQLFDLFRKAPTLGSLINPHRFLGSGRLDEKSLAQLHRILFEVIAEKSRSVTDRHEMGITAQGLLRAAELLTGHYTLVVTNVPYLGRGKQDAVLKEHLETLYPLGKADLATAFVLRCLEFCAEGGAAALVTPQNWLFLTTYTKLRQTLLKYRTWNAVARLGPAAFETISGHVVNVALSILSASIPMNEDIFVGVDVSEGKNAEGKSTLLRGSEPAGFVLIQQVDQLSNPDSVLTFSLSAVKDLLSSFADGLVGILNGDSGRFERFFWELPHKGLRWEFEQSTVDSTRYYGGREKVILWDNGNGELRAFGRELKARLHDADYRGNQAWGKRGVAVKQMGTLPVALYDGDKFDTNVAVILPRRPESLAPIWAFCSSPEYGEEVRRINQKLNVTNASLVKVPFDLTHWQKIAREKYPDGLPEPESDDPAQWLFHGRPEHSSAPLQVAVARLLGYCWPAELDREMRLSRRARDLISLCDELLPLGDKDGIVCIPPVRGEASAADRLLGLLAKAYGTDWSTDTLTALLKDVGFGGKSLEVWLRDGFFLQHCELFHQRPFIWQIWDGLRDGFSVLINYHKLDRKNLENLIYTYLGDWISRQKQAKADGVDGAEERLAAAESLKKRLELIPKGEEPYDIFVRWKPLQLQPIGWELDLNDGLRINIRPFLSVPDLGKKGAGVLRDKPNINWNKDRGKDVASAPWYHLGPKYGGNEGDRINNHHLTIQEKLAARKRKGDL